MGGITCCCMSSNLSHAKHALLLYVSLCLLWVDGVMSDFHLDPEAKSCVLCSISVAAKMPACRSFRVAAKSSAHAVNIEFCTYCSASLL